MGKKGVCFLVTELQEEIKTEDGEEMDLTWANGMIGIMPVFDTKKHAMSYAEDDEEAVIRMVGVPDDPKKGG